ncbi:TraB/GumN family protein [Saliphagus infecundisoli]|uniref:TraB/GumN family protein n=1 Tax=Saliphagus infecundisoli TaxID=1849069 RepID=A0ABD5QJ10_9EURY|nr:TraB/GumN family protein [Saliphagus infecundisoli]
MTDGGDPTVPEAPDTAPPEAEQGEVTVLGTAHVSHASVEDVHETVDRERPDVVAVELDEGRYRQLQGGAPEDIEARDLLSGNTVFQFLAYWMLSYVQSRLGERFDIEPGADMRAAIEAAGRTGAGVALVDRDIQVTMQRFWTRLSMAEKVRMVGGLAMGATDPRTVAPALGAGFGLVAGLVAATVLAPMVGLGDALALGVTDPGVLQYAGAVGVGVLGGVFLGLLVVPPLGRGLLVQAASGVAVGIAACLAVVATGTFVGPLSAAALESAGALAVRGLVGVLAGVGLGGLAGAVLGVVLADSASDVEELDEIAIEEMTDGDVVAAMMEEFRQFSPRGAQALIDERDAYIAHKLHALRQQGVDVVAVVGVGHKAGIEAHLANPEGLPPLESITGTASGRRFSVLKVFGYLMAVGFVAFFGLLIMAGVRDTFLLQLFAAWFLFNGIFAFTLARLAGARWASATVGGAVAWLTSINPLLAPGWFAGYVELRYRPINVGDIGRLNEIMDDTELALEEAFAEMLEVPLFRLIVIVALTNIGSMIASLLFVVVVLPWLAGPEFGGIDALMGELVEGARNSAELIGGAIGG